MLNKICWFLIALMASVSVYADINIHEAESQALKFAESVACGVDIRDTKQLPSQGYKDDKYIVWWQGDWGCLGGSGTTANYLTLVGEPYSSFSNTPLVRNFDILDEVNENRLIINSRFITNIAIRNDDAIVITSSRLAEGDPKNFPSKNYRYTIQQVIQQEEESGVTYDQLKWQVTNTRYLGSN